MNAPEEMVAAKLTAARDQSHGPRRVLSVLLSFGIGESALAAQLGVSPPMITNWKQGNRSVSAEREAELYGLLGEFIASKQQTIELIKKQGRWDRTMSRLLRQRFREAEKVYAGRPERLRDEEVA